MRKGRTHVLMRDRAWGAKQGGHGRRGVAWVKQGSRLLQPGDSFEMCACKIENLTCVPYCYKQLFNCTTALAAAADTHTLS